MMVLCAQIQTRIEKRYDKKLKRLEEQAELNAYRKLMENFMIRKEI